MSEAGRLPPPGGERDLRASWAARTIRTYRARQLLTRADERLDVGGPTKLLIGVKAAAAVLGVFREVPAILKHHNTYCSYADTIMPQFFFAVGFAYRLTFLRRLHSAGYWEAAAASLRPGPRA